MREVRQIVPAHVVVCDNGSTDNTAAEALAAGAHVVYEAAADTVSPALWCHRGGRVGRRRGGFLDGDHSFSCPRSCRACLRRSSSTGLI